MMDKVSRFQKYLPVFRACAGWTAQDLADLLDVSRQSVSAWENYSERSNKKGVKLSKSHYLAIRYLLEYEVNSDLSEGEKDPKHIISTMLEVLVDNPSRYTKEDAKAVLKQAEILAPSLLKNPDQRKNLSKLWPALLLGTGCVLSASLIAILEVRKGMDRDRLQ